MLIVYKEHIEIFRETYGTRFEAWRVLIDPKEKLYPVYWKWDEGKFDNRELAAYLNIFFHICKADIF